MSKSKSSPRVFSRDFKLGIIRRILAGENVSALGRELRLSRKDLYAWRDRFLAGGPEALRGRGRPRRPSRRPRRLRRRARALPSWSARLASSRSIWIFYGKPCGRSGEHAGRAPELA